MRGTAPILPCPSTSQVSRRLSARRAVATSSSLPTSTRPSRRLIWSSSASTPPPRRVEWVLDLLLISSTQNICPRGSAKWLTTRSFVFVTASFTRFSLNFYFIYKATLSWPPAASLQLRLLPRLLLRSRLCHAVPPSLCAPSWKLTQNPAATLTSFPTPNFWRKELPSLTSLNLIASWSAPCKLRRARTLVRA